MAKNNQGGSKTDIRFKLKNNVLARWIILSCITLMIPVSCAVINYFFNLNLLREQNDQINYFVLETVSNDADSRLTELRSVAENITADSDFSSYNLNAASERVFLQRALQCYQTLNIDKNNSSGYEALVYVPGRDYVIDTYTANELSWIYKTLCANDRISLALDEWRTVLESGGSATVLSSYFTISDQYGYNNYGKECFVYVTPNVYVGSEGVCWIHISVPTDFMNTMLESRLSEEMTLLILDRQEKVIGQYGKSATFDDLRMDMSESEGTVYFSDDGVKYVGTYRHSSISGWTYLLCTPEQSYMDAINSNRNMNLAVITVGAVLGIALVILVQKKNYSPLKKIVAILPKNEDEENEFGKIENQLRGLYNENRQMVTAIEKRKEQVTEANLYALVKGRNNYLSPLDRAELLGERYREQYYAFVTISLDPESEVLNGDGDRQMDRDLLWFVVDNVITEVAGEDYGIIRTMDGETLVYLVIVKTPEKKTLYETSAAEQFHTVTEFFQTKIQTEIAVTLGAVTEGDEHLESAYMRMEEINEQRYYTQPYGVLREADFTETYFSSRNRLQYYSKSFSEIARTGNLEAGKQLSREFFGEIRDSHYSFYRILYYVMDIVNYVIMDYHDEIIDKENHSETLDKEMNRLRQADNLSDLHKCFDSVFKVVCKGIDEEEQDGARLEIQIEQYVREHYADCNMNISTIASETKISSRYMSQIFKEKMGASLLSFINYVRIEHARELLKNTSMTVEEIAEATGYTNARTFRRNFLKTVGMTAAQYRSREV
ncbi:MAG: helix-turn-helix domain-containing protein [Lachnospiraceae bacterium]|nr:helix-turn-helix domain-containing protein [Lachnospiraceae bacterium]